MLVGEVGGEEGMSVGDAGDAGVLEVTSARREEINVARGLQIKMVVG